MAVRGFAYLFADRAFALVLGIAVGCVVLGCLLAGNRLGARQDGGDRAAQGWALVSLPAWNYSCAGVCASFWYAGESVRLLFAIGSRVG